MIDILLCFIKHMTCSEKCSLFYKSARSEGKRCTAIVSRTAAKFPDRHLIPFPRSAREAINLEVWGAAAAGKRMSASHFYDAMS